MGHLQSLDLTELDWTGVLSSQVQSACTAHQSNSVIVDDLCMAHVMFSLEMSSLVILYTVYIVYATQQ